MPRLRPSNGPAPEQQPLAGADAVARHLRRAGAEQASSLMRQHTCEIHTVERALRVGSVNRIIGPRELRPYVIDALECGMARWAGDGRQGELGDG